MFLDQFLRFSNQSITLQYCADFCETLELNFKDTNEIVKKIKILYKKEKKRAINM